ncbi:MAG: hypothetical protein PWR01_190 [Clostridiales bacterium]|jgi:hypothetical protein|nr:hypothetical protein [Clostridiales bacterium]
MNYIDYIILSILSICALIGVYNGFVASGLGFLSSLFSWLTSLIFYPLLSKFLVHQYPDLIKNLIYYTEGASKVQSIEEQALLVSSLTQEQIINIVTRAQLPPPFDRLLLYNMLNETLPHLTTVGEYFNYSVAYIILNIICFITLFVIIRVVCQIGISITKEVAGLPALKKYDGLAGAGVGLLRGMFLIFLLFSLVPVILTLAPLDIIYSLIENSLLGKFFFKSNIFTNFIKGFV